MSLLSGMNGMLDNTAAMEEAMEELLLEDELAMEADELIDEMVDGEDPYDDDEDLLGEDEDVCCESAALVGLDFLKSLSMASDDLPIRHRKGSIGTQDSAATWGTNYSDEFDDDNDPITTSCGSIGTQDSAATWGTNYSAETDDNNDPITTSCGSIGRSGTAKDPVMESYECFSDLLGEDEIATEGLRSYMEEKRTVKRKEALDYFHLPQLDYDKVNQAIHDGNFSNAIGIVTAYNKKLEKVDNDIMGKAIKDTYLKNGKKDKTFSKMVSRLESMIRANYSLILKLSKDAKVEEYTKNGMSRKEAKRRVNKEFRNKNKGSANEAYIGNCLDMVAAYEAAIEGDPEETEDGSIGSQSSRAYFKGNYSDGHRNTNDMNVANDEPAGQKDSAASWEGNHSGGSKDTFDPIEAIDGSVGQRDSTAKDPAAEGYISLESELDFLNQYLNDTIDD